MSLNASMCKNKLGLSTSVYVDFQKSLINPTVRGGNRQSRLPPILIVLFLGLTNQSDWLLLKQAFLFPAYPPHPCQPHPWRLPSTESSVSVLQENEGRHFKRTCPGHCSHSPLYIQFPCSPLFCFLSSPPSHLLIIFPTHCGGLIFLFPTLRLLLPQPDPSFFPIPFSPSHPASIPPQTILFKPLPLSTLLGYLTQALPWALPCPACVCPSEWAALTQFPVSMLLSQRGAGCNSQGQGSIIHSLAPHSNRPHTDHICWV